MINSPHACFTYSSQDTVFTLISHPCKHIHQLTTGRWPLNSSALIWPHSLLSYSPRYLHTAFFVSGFLRNRVHGGSSKIWGDAYINPGSPRADGIEGFISDVGNTNWRLRGIAWWRRKCWSLPPYARRMNFRGTGIIWRGLQVSRYSETSDGGRMNASFLWSLPLIYVGTVFSNEAWEW